MDTDDETSPADETVMARARADFARAREAMRQDREAAAEDLRFARLGEQWPEAIRRARELEGRPCLTLNRLPAFIRQVVNEARGGAERADPQYRAVLGRGRGL